MTPCLSDASSFLVIFIIYVSSFLVNILSDQISEYPSHPRTSYFNIDDSHMEEAYGLLKEYRRTKAVGMHIVSRKEIEAQYVEEPRSSAVIEYDVGVEVAPARDIKFH